jgi:hypothetical protein
VEYTVRSAASASPTAKIKPLMTTSPRGAVESADHDAERHTHKATTPALKELWAKVANESLERTGDEGRAIREANAVVARQAGTSK